MISNSDVTNTFSCDCVKVEATSRHLTSATCLVCPCRKVCWRRRTSPTTRWPTDRPTSPHLTSSTWRAAERESYPSGSCQSFCQGLLDSLLELPLDWSCGGADVPLSCVALLSSAVVISENKRLESTCYVFELSNDFLHF